MAAMGPYNMILAARDKVTGMPENFGGLEWKDVTNIHPVGLAAVLLLGVAMLLLPRRWATIPMLIIACFIPSVQKVVVFGLDFTLLRIMVVFGVARLLLKKEYIGFAWKKIDSMMVGWVISSTVMHTLQQGSFSALVNRLGFGFEAIGMYFVFRCLIRRWADVDTIVFGLILISIPVAQAFLVENRTGRNVFSVFGGVPEITVVREGRLRCQGAFSHPILAGCFWASLMPLFAARWWKSANGKLWAIVGLIASFVIVICCASSTPVMGIVMALIGGLFYYVRNHMRYIRWGVIAVLVALHMVMNNPVWHLICRIDIAGGSTGWHRYHLIDQAIKHFGGWWLWGTASTLYWDGIFDITNQYIFEGVIGGVLALGFFVWVIVLAFSGVGRLWRYAGEKAGRYDVGLSWALGVALFVHCVQFVGVSYFGQIYISWYLLLAMIGSLTPVRQKA